MRRLLIGRICRCLLVLIVDMGGFVNSSTAAANAQLQAAQARTQGVLQRRQAYADAYKLESDSAAALMVAGENAAVLRQNQAAQVAAARVQNGGSGFDASSGSVLRREQSVAEEFEQAIANMGRSAAVQDANARAQAVQLRREGDSAVLLADIMGDYYGRVARANRVAAGWNLLGGALSTVGNLGLQYNVGGAVKKSGDRS